jgi:hypothetical protein
MERVYNHQIEEEAGLRRKRERARERGREKEREEAGLRRKREREREGERRTDSVCTHHKRRCIGIKHPAQRYHGRIQPGQEEGAEGVHPPGSVLAGGHRVIPGRGEVFIRAEPVPVNLGVRH